LFMKRGVSRKEKSVIRRERLDDLTKIAAAAAALGNGVDDGGGGGDDDDDADNDDDADGEDGGGGGGNGDGDVADDDPFLLLLGAGTLGNTVTELRAAMKNLEGDLPQWLELGKWMHRVTENTFHVTPLDGMPLAYRKALQKKLSGTDEPTAPQIHTMSEILLRSRGAWALASWITGTFDAAAAGEQDRNEGPWSGLRISSQRAKKGLILTRLFRALLSYLQYGQNCPGLTHPGKEDESSDEKSARESHLNAGVTSVLSLLQHSPHQHKLLRKKGEPIQSGGEGDDENDIQKVPVMHPNEIVVKASGCRAKTDGDGVYFHPDDIIATYFESPILKDFIEGIIRKGNHSTETRVAVRIADIDTMETDQDLAQDKTAWARLDAEYLNSLFRPQKSPSHPQESRHRGMGE
jgi:hypothetical protein